MHASPTYIFGLIGYPLGYSLSPQIHGAALHALSLSGEYRIHKIPPIPAGQAELAALVSRVRTGEIHGLNVTIPHKQNVIPLLDKLTPAALTIGAVNTIFLQDSILIGDNTDAPGFWRDLQNLTAQRTGSGAPVAPLHPSALVLGAGGSARAVVYALLTQGYHVTISARRVVVADEIYQQFAIFRDRLSIVNFDHQTLDTEPFSLLVNCTPVGQHPQVDASPWSDEVPLPPNAAVYDLVYNPRATRLVQRAQAAGLPAASGLGMLVEQAALALERWTGLEAPRDVMLKTVNF